MAVDVDSEITIACARDDVAAYAAVTAWPACWAISRKPSPVSKLATGPQEAEVIGERRVVGVITPSESFRSVAEQFLTR